MLCCCRHGKLIHMKYYIQKIPAQFWKLALCDVTTLHVEGVTKHQETATPHFSQGCKLGVKYATFWRSMMQQSITMEA